MLKSSRTLYLLYYNKKFELMLTRRAKAYSSSSSQIALVYFWPFRRNSLLKCAAQPKIAKNNKNPLFWEFTVFQCYRCWYDWKAGH